MSMKRLLMITVVLMLLCSVAMAETLSAPMSEQDMAAIWQASFDRMGTWGAVNLSGELPEKGMITYDRALAIARQAIFDKYGTPAEELDAMGVYPDYYMEAWHLYFSPVKEQDVAYDSGYYAAPGAYRVYMNARTGEVTYCNWYMDEFWDYAQRVWDNGSKDTVYGRAKTVSFFQQSQEQQEHFRQLLTEAGYDVSVINNSPEHILQRKKLDIMFADPATVVQPEDDPLIAKAWAAVGEKYGLDTALMRKYAYCATWSDLDLGTEDVFIAYNYEQEFLWQEEHITDWDCRLFSYAQRLGNFLVQMDAETGDVVNVVRVYTDEEELTGDKLLHKNRWTAEDLVAFDQAFADYKQQMDAAVASELPYAEQNALHYEILHAIGGEIGQYKAIEIARAAAAEQAGMTQEAFLQAWPEGDAFYGRDGVYEVELWAGEGPVWQVLISSSDGEVISVEKTDGVG